jgi:hypothetical protein
VAQELITLPLRVSVRVAGVLLKAAGQAVGVAERIVRPPDGRSPDERSDERAPAEREGVDTSDVREAAEAAIEHDPLGEEPYYAPPEDEPIHVSEEPELVEEFAEPGAEDGAGAEISVSEPWSGYDDMPAQDVIARLEDASAAELAAVQLYERANRQRETVLAAAERQLQAATRGGSN